MSALVVGDQTAALGDSVDVEDAQAAHDLPAHEHAVPIADWHRVGWAAELVGDGGAIGDEKVVIRHCGSSDALVRYSVGGFRASRLFDSGEDVDGRAVVGGGVDGGICGDVDLTVARGEQGLGFVVERVARLPGLPVVGAGVQPSFEVGAEQGGPRSGQLMNSSAGAPVTALNVLAPSVLRSSPWRAVARISSGGIR